MHKINKNYFFFSLFIHAKDNGIHPFIKSAIIPGWGEKSLGKNDRARFFKYRNIPLDNLFGTFTYADHTKKCILLMPPNMRELIQVVKHINTGWILEIILIMMHTTLNICDGEISMNYIRKIDGSGILQAVWKNLKIIELKVICYLRQEVM